MTTPVNQVTLTGTLVRRDVLRLNPSGVEVLDLDLWHEAEVVEAGQPRRLQFLARAKALGQMALTLDALADPAMGCSATADASAEDGEVGGLSGRFSGFVAPRAACQPKDLALSRRPEGLVFHITHFESE